MANDPSTTEKAFNGKPPQRNALKCLPVCLPRDKDEDGSGMVSSAGECLLFENTGTATLIIEDNGVISMVNNKALESFGYAREEVLA